MMKAWVARVAVIVSLALAGYIWWTVARANPATAVREIRWLRADGTAPPPGTGPYPFDGCAFVHQFRHATWRSGLLIYCEDKEVYGPGFAFIDPERRDARLLWPLPAGMTAYRMAAIRPGAADQLAIVIQTHDHEIAVGVADPKGWVRVPARIENVDFVGVAWVGGAVEVVVRVPEAPMLRIVRYEGATPSERTVACTDCRDANPVAIYLGDHWHFDDGSSYDGRKAFNEKGEPVTPIADGEYSFDIEQIAHGVLRKPFRPTSEIDRDGTRRAVAERDMNALLADDIYAIEGTTIRRVDLEIDRATSIRDTKAGAQRVRYGVTSDDRLRMAMGDAPLGPPIALWSMIDAAAIIPTSTGYFMVQPGGEYIVLDKNLRRTDSLSLREHLTHRATYLRSINEPEHVHALWAGQFVGAAIALLVTVLALGGAIRRDPIVNDNALIAIALVSVAFSAYAIVKALPMLA